MRCLATLTLATLLLGCDTVQSSSDAGLGAAADALPAADAAGANVDAMGSQAGDSGQSMEPDGGASADSGSAGQPFGATCTMDQECAMGLVCRSFNMLGMVCTQTCTDSNQCPSGSMGQRCNMQGLCRP